MPLFKSGNTEEMDSYRPISILPKISKIAEEVVHHQLFGYLNVNKTMILRLTTVISLGMDVEKLILMPSRDYSIELRS